jgi:hypothetical protein
MEKPKTPSRGGGAVFTLSYTTRHCGPTIVKKGVSVLVSPLPVKVSTTLQVAVVLVPVVPVVLVPVVCCPMQETQTPREGLGLLTLFGSRARISPSSLSIISLSTIGY